MNVFDLMAKIGLDVSSFESGLKGAGESFSSFGAKLKTGIATAGKLITAGTAAVSAGVTALTKAAVESYSNYEQLAGGVQTLFAETDLSLKEYAESVGKTTSEALIEYNKLTEASRMIMINADNAYKTAGLSANEYMETVTSFSASLIANLGGDTVKAAKYADMALVDMADNANKMGTSIDLIQNAYQGFAKGSYVMLDNLKLGYGGTMTEMARLINDSGILGDEMINLADKQNIGAALQEVGFAKITEAIHIMQERLGIAGATAAEAENTIQGSLSMVSASWKNLMTDIVMSGDTVGEGFYQLTESVKIAGKNLLPAIKSALEGIAILAEELIPVVIEELPGIIQDTIPAFSKAVKTIFTAVIDTIGKNKSGLEKVFKSVFEFAVNKIKEVGSIIQVGKEILEKLISGIQQHFPMLLEIGAGLVESVGGFIFDSLPKLLESGVAIITTLGNFIAQSLPELIPTIVDVVLKLAMILTEPDTLMPLLDSAIAIILALVEGIIYALPQLLDQGEVIITRLMDAVIVAVPKLAEAAKEIIAMIVGGILANLDKILAVGVSLVMKFIEGIYTWSSKLYTTAVDAVNEVKEGFSGGIEAAKEWGADLIDNFIGGIKAKWENLKNTITEMAQMVQDFIGFSEPKEGPLSNFHTYAPDMMDLFAKGIKENKHKITGELSTALYGVDSIMSVKPATNTGGVYQTYHININGAHFSNNYDAYKAAEDISRNLKALQLRDQRAIGGY